MEATILVIWVAVAAFVGGVAIAFLGWAKQSPPEPWDSRKFIPSAVTALIGAAVIAVGFNYSGITNIAIALLGAFISGTGINAGVSAGMNVIAANTAKKLAKLK